MCFKDVPSFNVKEGVKLIDMLVDNKICTSKREAREFIQNGAISINGKKCQEQDKIITKDLFIDGTFVVVKRGKKNYYLGRCN